MPCSVLLILLQLCSLQLMLVAMPTCRLLGNVAQSAHHLLRDLGEPFPIHCRPYNANISFPDSALPAPSANHSQCHQALWVVYESLREAELMFDEITVGEDGDVTWDEQKFDTFRGHQNRLVEDGKCLSSVNATGVLSSYFRNVTAVVEQQDSAACGWLALRRDLLWVLKTTLQRHHACFSWRGRRHAHNRGKHAH